MIQDKKQEELNYLKKRVFIFMDYFYEKYGHQEIYRSAKAGMEKEFEKQNLRGFKATSKDMNNWLREMPVKDAIELGEILKRELGEDLTVLEQKRLKAIERIIKKGKIANLEEYELIHNRTDEIYADPNKRDELNKLNQLLVNYDTK